MQWRLSKGANALRQIIIVNLLVFVVSLLITIIGKLMVNNAGDVLEYFYLPSNLKLLLIRPWTLLTNIFMHFDLKHILINMLVLYMIGRILQDFVSNNQFWTIFMGGALLGSLFYLFSYNVFPAFKDVVGQSMLMGASGGVTAITVATGVFVPNFEVRLFGVLPIKMNWIAGLMVLIDVDSLPQRSNPGGVLAHRGGAIFGATYVLNMRGR
jgi:membrane associated rhomboid family serine protease